MNRAATAPPAAHRVATDAPIAPPIAPPISPPRAPRAPTNHTGEGLVNRLLSHELRQHGAVYCKSHEGCRADGRVVRPGHGEGVVPIQIKTTAGPVRGTRHQYKFNRVREYSDCMVLCCSLDEMLFWLIPGSELNSINTLKITRGHKWDAPFAVTRQQLAPKLLAAAGIADPHEPTLFEPRTAKQRLEVEGLRSLMHKWPVRVSLPDEEQGTVDCVVRDTRHDTEHDVQCKTAYPYRGGLRVDVSKTRRGRKVAYEHQDFDLLVVHLRDSPERKYVFPIGCLDARGRIGPRGKTWLLLRPDDPKHWAANFLRHASQGLVGH